MAAFDRWYTQSNPQPTTAQATQEPDPNDRYAILSLPHFRINPNPEDEECPNPEPIGAVIHEIEGPAQGLRHQIDQTREDRRQEVPR